MKSIVSSSHQFWQSKIPLIGITTALVALAVITVFSLTSIDVFQDRAHWVDHTYQVRSNLEETLSVLRDARTAARGFVISGQPTLLPAYAAFKRDVPARIESLRVLLQDDPEQLRNITTLQAMIATVFADLEAEIQLRKDSVDPSQAIAYVASSQARAILDGVRTEITVMEDVEKGLLAQRSSEAAQSAHQTKILIVFGTTVAFLMLVGAFWLLLREVRQRQSADKAVLAMNKELVRHASQLEATNKELESFSYSVSHDLRIPLRAISGYARMLQEDYADKLDDEAQRLLKVIRDNSKRMGELIDDLLTFSRLGRKPIAAAEIDMKGVVDHIIEEVRRRTEHDRVEIQVDTLPPTWGDRSLLQQVWTNLISNAIKYSGKRDQPVIRIEGKNLGTETVYSISDNGVGFDMQYYNKLFGVFQRLHSADEFPGTGVGLAIVHRIVVRLGGRVWAVSTIDEGATFFFAFPQK